MSAFSFDARTKSGKSYLFFITDRQTDGRTDMWTDGQTVASSAHRGVGGIKIWFLQTRTYDFFYSLSRKTIGLSTGRCVTASICDAAFCRRNACNILPCTSLRWYRYSAVIKAPRITTCPCNSMKRAPTLRMFRRRHTADSTARQWILLVCHWH